MSFSALNNIVGSWYTILSVCIGLAMWASWSAHRLDRACARLHQSLEGARGRIGRIDPEALARSFEALRVELGRDPLLGPAWRAWAETVLVSRDGSGQPRATLRPEQVFDLGLVRRAGANLRYHAALPGLLVVAGLLFTFLALAVALANAGDIVTATSADARNSSLKGLLDAASIKFVTSLVGLLCSIVYAWYRSRRLTEADRDLDEFCDFLEEKFPVATSASLQAEANRHLESQRKTLDSLANDLARSIGPALDKALDDRLGEHIEPLRRAIEKLAARETDSLAQTLQKLVDRFVQQLDRAGTNHLERVAAHQLAEAAQGLSTLRQTLGQAVERLDRATQQVGSSLQEAMRQAGESSRARIAETVESMAQASGEAAGQLQRVIEASGEKLLQSIESAASRIEGAAEHVERSSAATREAGAALIHSSTKLATVAQQAAEALRAGTQPVAAAAAALEGTAEKARSLLDRVDALARGLQQASAQNHEVAQALARTLATTRDLQSTLQATSQSFATIDRSLGDKLEQVDVSLRGFAEQIERVVKEVDQNLSRAVTGLSGAIRDLDEVVEELRPDHRTLVKR